jgi:predicted alpha-1,2-mannosidase
VMLGSSADIVIADAVLRGADDFDVTDAYARLRAIATAEVAPALGRGGWDAVEPYLAHGYVPASHGRSVSLTTEYAHADFALSQLAAALGEADDAAMFLERSRGYRLLFDPDTGFLRGRFEDGSLTYPDDFDPLHFSSDYAEANAWHSVWMAGAHDIDGLVALFGGTEPFVERLSIFFEEAADDLARRPHDDMASNYDPRPYYWHGNEPDIHAAYLFAQAGRPDLAQRWVRWIMTELYNDRENGLAGNDDGGTLSSWYVLSALGIYPIPGSDRFVLGAPLFPLARVAVPGGVFTIEAPEASAENLYVQGAELDGRPLDAPELGHGELRAGSTLRVHLGPHPSAWGRQ